MKKWMLFVLPLSVFLTGVITWFTSLYVFERPVLDKSVAQKTIHSPSLAEQRDYLVHLPESYEYAPNQRYPVIYVLDGSSQDVHTAASAALMARIGVTPEVIVVGIPNTSGKGRQRDYTPPGMRQDLDYKDSPDGDADKFLAFMRHELIATIDKNYRTTSLRILAGNSRGGLFVVYAFTADPTLFDIYIANSPALWRDNHKMVRQLDRFLQEDRVLKSNLFLSLGSDENDKMKGAFQGAIAVLQNHAPPTLRWYSQFSVGATHDNNSELATPVALRWAFEANWVPPGAVLRTTP